MLLNQQYFYSLTRNLRRSGLQALKKDRLRQRRRGHAMAQRVSPQQPPSLRYRPFDEVSAGRTALIYLDCLRRLLSFRSITYGDHFPQQRIYDQLFFQNLLIMSRREHSQDAVGPRRTSSCEIFTLKAQTILIHNQEQFSQDLQSIPGTLHKDVLSQN